VIISSEKIFCREKKSIALYSSADTLCQMWAVGFTVRVEAKLR